MSATDLSVASAIPADDRGLAYGDGLFETMRTEGGTIPLLERHLDRLLQGCQRIGLPAPSRGTISSRVRNAAEILGEGVVKLIVTRGSGGRGYRPPGDPRPRTLVTTGALPVIPDDWYRVGVCVQICSTRVGRSAATAGLKSLGRLEQVLASAELADDVAEGLMLDEHEHVIEGTRCNLFLIGAGGLLTPRLDMSGVAGVMRSLVMDLAGEIEARVREERIDLDLLQAADEMFLTNSVLGVLPVRQIAGLGWRGTPGPITRRVMRAVAERGFESWAP